MKIAPIIDAIRAVQRNGENISFRLIHTGQRIVEHLLQLEKAHAFQEA